jgi:hypothetical protein
MIARMGWVPHLDGTVIAYVVDAERLIAGGRFRTDLSLDEMASALGISAKSIANPRSPDDVDPDAELFRALSGMLTARSKESARTFQRQLLAGKSTDDVLSEWVITEYEWVITEFSFTLRRLKHPSDAEKSVLSAIARAANGIMPAPGDKIRAVGLPRAVILAGSCLTPGMLPPARAMNGPGMEAERP